MSGAASMPGIIPQMNKALFERVAQESKELENRKFLVTCSYLEIYNEVLHDLLDPLAKKQLGPGEKRQEIEVKEHPSLGV